MNRSDVCGIVVTYHPDAEFPDRSRIAASQLGAMVIVDNGSSEAEIRLLRSIASGSGLTLILNSENLGIARALNIGIERASALGYRWVLLLDQDSQVHEDLLDILLVLREAYPHKPRLAVIGSGYRDLRGLSASPGGNQSAEIPWDEAESVITSGSLLSLAIYSLIGPFREDFFIDHVDIEFCFRARARGYRVINSRRPLMSHSIGTPTRHKWLWMTRLTTNHCADRCYYFARNDTVLLRDYGNYKWGLWSIKSLCRRVRTCKRIVLYEDSKGGKIFAVIGGWWDGIRGNMGPRSRKA